MSDGLTDTRSQPDAAVSILRAGLSSTRTAALLARLIDRVTVEVSKAPVRGIDTNIRTLTYRGDVIARLEAADGRVGWTERDEGRMRRFIEDVEMGR